LLIINRIVTRSNSMNYPDFFNEVEAIELQDPLSDFLGVFRDGKVTITYLDCVKLAGHSCPTVAGAYLMTLQALKKLYPDGLPQRSSIQVDMRDAKEQGVTGVIATVISYIVGASDEGGFKGIKGKMSRKNLLGYDANIKREVSLTRLDTGASVEIDYDPSAIAGEPQMQLLMGKMVQNIATAEEKILFGTLWQERVKKILLSKEKWDEMIRISEK